MKSTEWSCSKVYCARPVASCWLLRRQMPHHLPTRLSAVTIICSQAVVIALNMYLFVRATRHASYQEAHDRCESTSCTRLWFLVLLPPPPAPLHLWGLVRDFHPRQCVPRWPHFLSYSKSSVSPWPLARRNATPWPRKVLQIVICSARVLSLSLSLYQHALQYNLCFSFDKAFAVGSCITHWATDIPFVN